MHTIIEPFRIKMVEPLRMTTRSERDANAAWTDRSKRCSRPRNVTSTAAPT